MKQVIYLPFFFLLTSCLAGLQTRNEIKGSDRQVDSSRPSAPSAKAEQESRIQYLEEQNRYLTGQIEELQHSIRQNNSSKTTDDLSRRMQNLEDKVLAYGETLMLYDKELNTLRANGATSSSAVAVSAKSAAAKSSAEDSNPFTKAESLFGKSQWKNAILEYNKYRENYPKGKNYSEATYKIGVCFQELKMQEDAKGFFQEVVEKYPKSKFAKSAKYRLNQLKK